MIRNVVPAAIAGVLAALFVTTVTTYAPAWEGGIWPVAVTHKVDYTLNEDGAFVVSGNSTKIRDCTLVETVVYVLVDGKKVSVEEVLPIGPVRLRPLGAQFDWGPWLLVSTAFEPNSVLQGVTYHRCHPLWLTQTVFWSIPVKQVGVVP